MIVAVPRSAHVLHAIVPLSVLPRAPHGPYHFPTEA